MRARLSAVSTTIAIASLTLAAGLARADFSYSLVFGQPAELTANGAAFYDESASRTYVLTSAGGQSGSLFHQSPQQVLTGWTTTFRFSIGWGPAEIAGDGFAFVLHNDPRGAAALAGGGSGMGYAEGFGDPPLPGISSSLAIEFDTFLFEGGGPQVAIHTNGLAANDSAEGAQLAAVNLPQVTAINILDGGPHTCTIEYVAPQDENPGTLAIYIDNQFILSTPFNFADVGGVSLADPDGRMYAGFTAGTGLADSTHMIHDWAFDDDTQGCVAPYAHSTGGGSCGLGCWHFSDAQVVGSLPMTFQWFKDGVEITDPQEGHFSGLNSSRLVINSPTLADNGYYKVIATNACGSWTSDDGFLGTCPGDIDDGSGTGTSDGGVDVNDLLYFLAQFELGSSEADLAWQHGGAIRDGAVDVNDLLFFLASFEGGC